MKSVFSIFIFCISSFILIGQELIFEKIQNVDFIQPVDIATTYISNDSRLFIVEKSGKIFIIDNPENSEPQTLTEPFLDLSSKVVTISEGGLLGLAFHPDYNSNGKFYVNYTFNDPENNNQFSTRVSQFSIDNTNPNLADPDSETPILTIEQPAGNHNGGDLAFGPDGYLYIPLGDGGGSDDVFKNGQNRLSLLGKILRIDINTIPYSIPADNPYANDDFTLDEIWSLGWRNPWRFAFDQENGDMWIADVGQGEWEEIDLEESEAVGGLNYGWSCKEGNEFFNPDECDENMFIDPVFVYDHSLGQKSVTGGFVYRGSEYPDLEGKYIFTDFVDSKVFWLSEKSGDDVITTRYDLTGSDLPAKVTTFGESSNLELYFATFDDGKIWKIKTNFVSTQNETNLNESLLIYPNPANDKITVEPKNLDFKKLTLLSQNGQIIQSNTANNTFDVSQLPTGNYIIKVHLDNQIISKTIQIQR